MEEKGERYKNGEKVITSSVALPTLQLTEPQAHRFYDKAVELYKKAFDFQQTYDAAYNL